MTDILFNRQEVRSREQDRQFVDGAGVADLDENLVRTVAGNYLHGSSVEIFLQQIGLAEYSLGELKLRMAALLLFAADMHRWHPRCEVRIVRVIGTEWRWGSPYNVTSDARVAGNIVQLVTGAWSRVGTHLVQKTELTSDARFEERYLYPEVAWREALINAIVHRDYGIQSPIEVFLFDDSLEIRSPGPLLSTVSIAGLTAREGVHEPRNALIARVLRESKLVPGVGEGMRRIFDAVRESKQEPPVLASNGSSFRIALRQGAAKVAKARIRVQVPPRTTPRS